MIELSQVTLINNYKKIAFNNLHIEKLVIPETGLTIVKAENKQGKTSLVNFLAGKHNHYTGNVYLGKYELKGRSKQSYLRKMSVILEEPTVINEQLSVFDNLMPCVTNQNKNIINDIDRIAGLLEIKNLSATIGDDKILIFKVLLLKALLRNPNLLLIDNLHDYVDSNCFDQIILLIKRVAKKVSVVTSVSSTNKFDADCDNLINIKDNNLIIIKHNKLYENNFKIKSIFPTKTNSVLSLSKAFFKFSSKWNAILISLTILFSIFLGLALFNKTSYKGYQNLKVNYSSELVSTYAKYFNPPERAGIITLSSDPNDNQKLLTYKHNNNTVQVTPPFIKYVNDFSTIIDTKQGRKPTPNPHDIEIVIAEGYAKKLLASLPNVFKIKDLLNKKLYTSFGVSYEIVGVVPGDGDLCLINENYVSEVFLKPGFTYLGNNDRVKINEFEMSLSENIINYLDIHPSSYPYELKLSDKNKLKQGLLANSFIELEKVKVIFNKVLNGDNKVEFSLSQFVLYLTNNQLYFEPNHSVVVDKEQFSSSRNPFTKIEATSFVVSASNQKLDMAFIMLSVLSLGGYVVIAVVANIKHYNNNRDQIKSLSNTEHSSNLFFKSLFLGSFLRSLVFFIPGLFVAYLSLFLTSNIINSYSIGITFGVFVISFTLFILMNLLLNLIFIPVKRLFK